MFRSREFKEAIEKYKQVIALDPGNVIALNNWGGALNNLGRYDEAIEKHERAVELDPDNFYMIKSSDVLAGRTTGFVAHEPRCMVELHHVEETNPITIHVAIVRADVTQVRHIIEDVYTSNNADPDGRLFTAVLDLHRDYYGDNREKNTVCPALNLGQPEIINVLSWNPEDPVSTAPFTQSFIEVILPTES